MRNPLSRRRASSAAVVGLAAVVVTCTAAAVPGPTASSAARKVATGKALHAVTPKTKKTPTRTGRAARLDKTPPTKPSRLRVVSTTQSTVTIAWGASKDRVGVAGYTLSRNDRRVGSAARRSYTFAALACGSSHRLGVRAYDAAGNRSARALILAATTACPDTQPPTQPGSVWQVAVTSSGVTLGWSPASDDFGVIAYEILSDGSLAGSTATTQYAVSGLACGTMHTLGVQALDAAGNRSPASNVLMATSPCPDSTAPSTPGPLVVRGSGETSVTLGWTSSSDNVGVVGYQVYRDAAAVGTTASTGYTVSGLACGKSYRIEVDAYDAAGNRSGKSARGVTTKTCPPPLGNGDTTPPSVPTGVTVSSTNSSSISLRWTASTDNVGVTGYGLYRDGVADGSSTLANATFSGLVCGRSYQLAIDATDASGNRSAQAGVVASTSPCSDTQPPSVPPALTQAGATETTAWISWGASTDNVGVAGYGIYVAGVRVDSTSSRAYTFTALACGTTYTVGVDAYDAAGARSARADLVVSTSACLDTAPPSAPNGLTTSGVTGSSVSLAWNASTDNVAVTGYGVYRDGVRIDSSSSRSYNFTGLACGTAYALGVDAVDASGNRSARAATNATTSACPPPPPPPPPPPGGPTIQPGQSWQSAYSAAAANSTLNVAAGDHGSQTISGTKKVTFLGANGAVLDELDNNAANVTLDNVDIDGNWAKVTILQNSGDNNTYKNLEIRQVTDIQMITNAGSFAVYDSVVFHDAVFTIAGENAGVHMECMWSNGPNLTIRNSTFRDCAIMDLLITRGDWYGQPNYCCVTLESNIFFPSERTDNGGVHFYSVFTHANADKIDGYVVRWNRFDLPFSLGDNPVVNSVFCGNTGRVETWWAPTC